MHCSVVDFGAIGDGLTLDTRAIQQAIDSVAEAGGGRVSLPSGLVEALALGTPVISTDCGSGPRELLDDGRLGRLVKVNDVPALAEALQQYVRKRLSAHAYPREIEFVSELPKTPSGKIQRFLLRNQEIAKAQAAASH